MHQASSRRSWNFFLLNLWYGLHLDLLPCHVFGLALVPSRHRRRKATARYFSQELVIPPLARLSENLTGTSMSGTNYSYSLPVLYTNDPRAVSDWFEEHVDPEGCMLGFDVESVPNIPYVQERASFLGPATVQVATSRAAMVIHLVKPDGRFSQACIPLLEAILNDDRIIKAGCGIDDDMLALRQRCSRLEAYGRYELGRVLATTPGEKVGLKRLSALLLGLTLPKPKSLATSDWSRVPLSFSQIAYSARDAWAGAAAATKLGELEPDLFALDRVMHRLQASTTITLDELEESRRKRKWAKNLLKKMGKVSPVTAALTGPALQWIEEAKSILAECRRESAAHEYQYYFHAAGNFTF